MRAASLALLVALLALIGAAGFAAEEPAAEAPTIRNGPIAVVELDGAINSASADHVIRAIERAEEMGAAILLFELDIGTDETAPLTGEGISEGFAELEDVLSNGSEHEFSIDLGEVVESEEGEPMTITVTNVGDELLEIDSITLEDKVNFRLESDTCSTGGPMAFNGTCQFNLVFTPQGRSLIETFLDIEYRLGQGPKRGLVFGTGLCFIC